MTLLDRILVACFAGTAIAAFARIQSAPMAWFLELPVLLSLTFPLLRLPGPVVAWFPKLNWILLGVTFSFRWLRMLFPFFSDGTVSGLSLTLGYGLAFLICVFLLCRGLWPLYSTLYPATIGLLVIASFRPGISIHAFLVPVAILVFLELVRGSATRAGKPWIATAFAAVLVALLMAGIIYLLPIAQGQVEQVIVRAVVPQTESSVGLGRHARLGAFERLKLSKRVVLRVWSARAQKLRGRVFTRWDGQSWHEVPAALSEARDEVETSTFEEIPGKTFVIGPLDSPEPTGRGGGAPRHEQDNAIQTRVVEAAQMDEMLLSPAGATRVRAPLEALRVSSQGVLVASIPRTPRVYGVLHGETSRADVPPLDDALQLPEALDPRLTALARELGRGAASPEATILRTSTYLQSNFHYSLDVGRFRSRDPLAEFLFEKKKGYCEYFATAGVVLLRAQGVPARYVSGLNVLPTNRVGDHYVVRESDAHAWVEAYVPGRGWVEVDPTPAAEYEALHRDLAEGAFLAEKWEQIGAWVSSKLADWRHRSWRDILRREPFAWLALGAVAFVFLRRRLRGLGRRGTPKPLKSRVDEAPTEIRELMSALERAWQRAGHPKAKSTGHLEHVRGLPEHLRVVSARAVDCYYRARFRGEAVNADEVAALREELR